jgi:c-di-GMP-binding flagellar brake protein YcgR
MQTQQTTTTFSSSELTGFERRRSKRVPIPADAKITVWDASGAPIGAICQFSRGGMRVRVFEGEDWLRAGEDYVFIMRAGKDVSFSAWVVVRNFDGREAGCEFQNLDPQVADQIGEIIGFYDTPGASTAPVV